MFKNLKKKKKGRKKGTSYTHILAIKSVNIIIFVANIFPDMPLTSVIPMSALHRKSCVIKVLLTKQCKDMQPYDYPKLNIS